jgi:alpha-beta hydrolase superfamily lysophospholipase
MSRLLAIPRSGAQGFLYGMFDVSVESRAGLNIACILLSPGIKPKGGPHQLYRKLSAAFLEQGVPVLRLDLAGIGDSHGSIASNVLNDIYAEMQAGRCVPDVLAAMDFLVQHHGIQRFLVGGLCGAAITGLLAAEADKRVAGLFSINMPVVLVKGKAAAKDAPTEAVLAADLQVLRRKALNPTRWWRLLTFKSDYRLMWSVLRGSLQQLLRGGRRRRVTEERTVADPDTSKVLMFLDRNFVRALFATAETGRSSLLLYGGEDRNMSEYQEYFAGTHAARLARYADRIHVRVVAQANHVLGQPEWVAEAKAHIADWLGRDILSAKPTPAAGNSGSWRALRIWQGAMRSTGTDELKS